MATRAQGPRHLPGRPPVAREPRLPRPARRHPGRRLHLGAASRRFVRVGMVPSGAPGTPRAPRHCPRVVGACVLGVVAAVVLGIVLAGAVVVGTPTGAVVVGAGPDGDVLGVPAARVAGGADRSAPATTTP